MLVAAGVLLVVVPFGYAASGDYARFYGMLAHFSPGAFTGVADDAGIMAWLSFAFFTGIGRDFTGIVPVSAGARALVGAQLIPSIGWVGPVVCAGCVGPGLFRDRRWRSRSCVMTSAATPASGSPCGEG